MYPAAPISENLGVLMVIETYTRIWVDLKIDGFFYPDFQQIARIRFSQVFRVAYNFRIRFRVRSTQREV